MNYLRQNAFITRQIVVIFSGFTKKNLVVFITDINKL